MSKRTIHVIYDEPEHDSVPANRPEPETEMVEVETDEGTIMVSVAYAARPSSIASAVFPIATRRPPLNLRATILRVPDRRRRLDMHTAIPIELISMCLAYFPVTALPFLSYLSTTFKQAADTLLRRALHANPSDFASLFFNAFYRIPRLVNADDDDFGIVNDTNEWTSLDLHAQRYTYHPDTLDNIYKPSSKVETGPETREPEQWADLVWTSKHALVKDIVEIERLFHGTLVPNTSHFVLELGQSFYDLLVHDPNLVRDYQRGDESFPVIYPRLTSSMALVSNRVHDLTSTGIFYNIADLVNEMIQAYDFVNPVEIHRYHWDIPLEGIQPDKVVAFARALVRLLVRAGLDEDMKSDLQVRAEHTGYLKCGRTYSEPALSRPTDRFENFDYCYAARKASRAHERRAIMRRVFGDDSDSD
jgi:hypothetical protein